MRGHAAPEPTVKSSLASPLPLQGPQDSRVPMPCCPELEGVLALRLTLTCTHVPWSRTSWDKSCDGEAELDCGPKAVPELTFPTPRSLLQRRLPVLGLEAHQQAKYSSILQH